MGVGGGADVGGRWQTRAMSATIGTPGGTPERPALFFSGPEEFRAWLEANHETATELWMGLYRKNVPDRGLTWEQAVPEALCFGWIDSVSQRIDDEARRRLAIAVAAAIPVRSSFPPCAPSPMRPAPTAARCCAPLPRATTSPAA